MEINAKWDLRKMYPTDALWDAALERVQSIACELAGQKGHAAASAAELMKTATLYEQLNELLDDVAVFAFSNFDADMSDKEAKKLNERCRNAFNEIGEKTSFLAPELMQYSLPDFERFCAEEPGLKKFSHFAEDFLAKKEHVLPGEQETLMVRMDTISASFQRIFEDLMVNDTVFPTIKDPDGKDFKAIESNYRLALTHPDRSFRRDYFKALLGTYKSLGNTLTSCYYGSVKGDVFTSRSRRYASARAMSLADNFIPEEVYDNLISTARANVKPMSEYIELRRSVLGLPDVHFYDLFVPMVKKLDREYTYEEAQQLVLKATAILGSDYTALIKRAFDERWIDVYPAPNKQTGAYSTGSYTSHPYVLLNFTGTLDDVFTLAHELGHSMHTWFSTHNQPSIYAGYSLFCAEVASTLNEQLLSAYLLDHAESDDERALLLDKKLDDLRSTFYRQTMFADFENETHKMVEKGEPLVPDALNRLHGELNSIYYGEKFVVDGELTAEWSRIPHFYRAFYVYQYATGISASTAIAHRILTLGAPAVEDYRRFLSSGSSLHPIELLKIAGVDMATPQPVLDTINEFEETLVALKKLLNK